MHFKEESIPQFLDIFGKHKVAIRNATGCTRLELLKDINHPNVYTTLSHWNDPSDLDNYRNSELFKLVWSQVKILFSASPQAFSLEKYLEL
jgi:quinol monooxygenase YgiN